MASETRRGRSRWSRRPVMTAAALILITGAQFVPVERTNPPVTSGPMLGPALGDILRSACYDCHSNETRWPWYSRVAPVSWLLADHVKEGRRHLNFSNWPTMDFELQDQLLREIGEEVSEGHMPPLSYRLIHGEARLDPAQKQRLLAWAKGE